MDNYIDEDGETRGGARMYFPSPPWYDIIHVSRILAPEALVPDVVGDLPHGSMPHCLNPPKGSHRQHPAVRVLYRNVVARNMGQPPTRVDETLLSYGDDAHASHSA
jgi:hypothetical protein